MLEIKELTNLLLSESLDKFILLIDIYTCIYEIITWLTK